jgi:4-diphosphocytidyl-2-C-methyl-D-erythritol kinase
MPDCGILIAKPAASVSTKVAYELFDAWEPKTRADIPAMEQALRAGDLKALAAALGNSLEAPIAANKPVISALRDKIRSAGAMGAMMTGSGSAVFGIYPDLRAARRAVGCCSRLAPTVMAVRPRGAYPD